MNHEQAQELLGPYALDAVDADEAAAVEAHLDECARCRSDVSDLRETAAMLAHSGGDAPTGLWDRIAASLGDAPPPVELDVQRRRRKRGPVMRTVAAAAAAVIIVVLGASVLALRHDVDHLQQQASSAPDPIALAADQALSAPESKVATLTGDADLNAVVVVDAQGQGYLLGGALPELTNQVYALWGAGPTGDITALGTVPGPGVFAFAVDPSVQQVMITAEDHPVSAPTSSPIMSGSLA